MTFEYDDYGNIIEAYENAEKEVNKAKLEDRKTLFNKLKDKIGNMKPQIKTVIGLGVAIAAIGMTVKKNK